MDGNKSILLIAFKFPPYAGVGAFRWSKLSKYLAERGYKIHVITVDWNNIGKDSYLKEVDNPNIFIHRIRSFYPHNFKYKRFKNTAFSNFLHISRHILLAILDIIWYEDEAHYWGSYLIPYCEKLIKKENIKNIISTGAPFMANYWAAKLKKRNPNINLVLDFRDPWSENKNFEHSMKIFKKRSLANEKFTVNNCNVLVAVTNEMLNGYKKNVKNKDVKCVVIPNAHDIEIKDMESIKKRNFSFLYAGGLIVGRQEPFKSFMKAVSEINEKIPELKIDIYGKVPNNIKRKYNKLFEKGIIEQHEKIHPDKIAEKMFESFVCLHFNAKFFPMSVSTKIFEYASLKRPTLSVNYGGEIDKLIKNHNFGISVDGKDIEKIKEEILKLYDIWKKDPDYQISPKNIESFHYKNIVNDFEKYFK